MARIIKDFYELRLPISDNGHTDNSGADWCTRHKAVTEFYYLLNNGSRLLGDLLDGLKTEEFYFDTEVKCHEAMQAYYMSHGVKYPYMDEWAVALSGNTTPTEKIDVNESQVMRFK